MTLRVFALNAPYHQNFSREQRSPAVTKSRTLYYPIWLAYCTGLLEKHGFSASLVDAPGADIDVAETVRRVQAFKPHLLLVSTSTPSISNDMRVAQLVKEAAGNPYTVLVGTHTTARPVETLERAPGVDAVTRSEYDWTVLELAETLAGRDPLKPGDLSPIKGLTWRGEDGTIITNPDRPEQPDISELPHAADVYKRHLFSHWTRYFYAITRHPVVTIVTGRGCPYRCTYCMWPQTLTGHKYRRRPVEAIVEEFQYIERTFPGVQEIFIEDDTFTVHPEHCRAVAEGLIRAKTKVRYTANARCDVDVETLKLLKRSGLRLLCVGVESADQKILNNVKKGIKVSQIREFFKAAKKADVLVHGCFMVGNKGETRETLQQTLEFAKELNPDTAQFFPLMIYPGTEAYEWARNDGLLETEDYDRWLTPDGMHNSVVVRPDLPSEELRLFCDRARREFYLRPRYIARKLRQSLKSPYEAKRTMKSFGTFARYLLKNEEGGARGAARVAASGSPLPAIVTQGTGVDGTRSDSGGEA
jgi:anaerobic magnesium-protoporphyrin IX monomethyl ester cyclase